MKAKVVFFLFIAFSINVNAQVKYDTLNVKQIGKGVFHYTIEAPSVPWMFQVVEIDITQAEYSIETERASKSLGGYEKTSSMAARNSYDGHNVIAAVNGDFYGNGGEPTNAQVIKGEMLKGPMARELFGYTRDKQMFINTTSYSGKVTFGENETTLNAVNTTRGENNLILYNHLFGTSTGTNNYGTEVALKAIDSWVVNGSVRAIITEKFIDSGNSSITDSTVVLSGHGTSADIVKSFSVGDTVSIYNGLLPGLDNVIEVVGGSRKFLDEGQNNGDWPERHPRTAVGFNADTTKVYLVTVDGRQPSSAGTTLNELADFMRTIGAYSALNLDGGGSTTMVVHNEVVNSPSDGAGERAVGNALFIVSSAPQLGVIEHVNLDPHFLKIYKGSTYTFHVSGSDANYYPADLDSTKIEYSISAGFDATISNDGIFKAGSKADTGYVYVNYEGARDSALMVIKSVTRLNLFPITAVTDSLRAITFFNKSYDVDGQSHYIDNSNIEWVVVNPEIGFVTENGEFYGLKEGTTQVIANYEEVSDTSVISVQIGKGKILLNGFSDLSSWSMSGENIDMDNTHIVLIDSVLTEGTTSLKLDYQFVYNNDPETWVKLATNIPVYGVPDSIIVDAKTDGKKHLIDVILTDNNDEWFSVRVKKWAENKNFDFYPAYLNDNQPTDPEYTFFFPVILKGINIKLASEQQIGETYSGTIYIDNLRMVYPGQTSVANESDRVADLPDKITLSQNYPNPFNPATNISFSLPNSSHVTLTVYDVLGREVMILVDENLNLGIHSYQFNASSLASGVYIYKLKTPASELTRKMTLIK